jgi:hypothetical protein
MSRQDTAYFERPEFVTFISQSFPMKNALLLLLFLLPFAAFSQQFPNDFVGTYTGNLHLISSSRNDSIPCTIIIAATETPDRWTNQMIFNPGEKYAQVNAYDWVRDPVSGTYVLDEKDGILITETLIDNTLYAHYTVEGMLFFVRTSFRDGAIDYELTVFDSASDNRSVSSAEGTEVHSFAVMTVQKGTLRREK